ncbi:NTP transferase domain-containing protein [Homoserinibacter sp. GY 40078]|nr:NTP transferase domain-containing protein [Homoserinibacter sp. GY 40078]
MHSHARTSSGWVVVIPVKPVAVGKSRLGAGPDAALAIALDTIEAVAAAAEVSVVVVVTADERVADAVGALPEHGARRRVVHEVAPAGIRAAVAAGLVDVADASPRAVLLGDVPTLDPAELDAALRLAAGVDRAFVADAEGTGTVLVTARGGVELREAFGPGSAEGHRALGLAELDLPAESGLRRDVDTPEQLADVVARGGARRTTALG